MISLILPGAIRSLLLVFVIAITGVLVCTSVVWSEIRRETDFRERYGTSWKSEYEEAFGSVGKARARMAVAAAGAVAIIFTGVWLIRTLRKGQYATGSGRLKHRKHLSAFDHTARARMNAWVGIYFGMAGIAIGVCLELFYLGILSREDQQVLGGFVFLGGYVAVISGCWWWLKAKAWSEALVFIGVMPLAILLIPFVRLLFLASPVLVAFSMVMSPIILVVVVFTLPDKSGTSSRRSRQTSRRSRPPVLH